MTVEKPKPKQLLRPITRGADSAMNQSELLAMTCNSLKAREKSRIHGAIGFGFDSHWLKNWRESFKPITKRSNRNSCSKRPNLMIYIFVCDLQDYHWWWRSFLTGGCTAVYFFLYSIHFFYSKLTITGTASTFLYFGYTLIMVLIFFLFTGKKQ